MIGGARRVLAAADEGSVSWLRTAVAATKAQLAEMDAELKALAVNEAALQAKATQLDLQIQVRR